MTTEEVKGIVLRTVNVGECDKLLTVYTEEKGKITASVRGSRSLKSRYFAAVQQYCFTSFVLVKKNDRYYVKETELLKSFFSLHEDLEKMALAEYICEAICYAGTEEPDTSLFRLIMNSIYAIAKGLYPLSIIKAGFEFRAAAILGFMPDIQSCASCGKMEGEFTLDVMNGVILCPDCAHTAEKNAVYDEERAVAYIVSLLTPGARSAIHHVLTAPIERLFSFRLEGEELRFFTNAAETYFINQMEKSFPSLDFYKKVITLPK